ncbi:MAG: hypothetical protein L0212_08085 [Acidobacteria bacterium]|nr:hypothetical protein [Acidobacteriota bacterium]
MYRNLALLFLLLPMGAWASPEGIVDVRACPGVAGDGVTDDGKAIQACLDANPGKHILFPKTRQKLDKPDYFIKDQTLTLRGYDQWIEGEGGERGGGTLIKFGPGMKGPAIRIRNEPDPVRKPGYGAQGAKISDINLQGSREWNPGNDAEKCALPVPCTPFQKCADGPDGIQILASNVTLENVGVFFFGRHGINIDTSGNSVDLDKNDNANLFTLISVTSYGNRGDGFHIDGGNSNAGVVIRCDASYNQLWGFNESSFLGNTYVQTHTSANHERNSTCQWPPGTTGGGYRAMRNVYKSPAGEEFVDHAFTNVFIAPYAEADQPKSALDYRQIVIGGAHYPAYSDAADPLQGAGPGVITAGITGLQIHFQGLTLLAAPFRSQPGAPSEYGTVMLNTEPDVGKPIGWVQVERDPAKPRKWQPFGTIQ